MRLWVVVWFVLLAGSAHASVFSFAGYDQTVLADSPELYWRLGEQTGTTAADATAHHHDGVYAAEGATRSGALANDADRAVADARPWYSSAYDLVSADAAGLPTAARTVEAWVSSDAPGARLIDYGGFSVAVDERALIVGTTRLSTPRLTDARWHHLVVTYDGTTLTSFVDGAQTDAAPATLSTGTTGGAR